jgi:hypothetical protein
MPWQGPGIGAAKEGDLADAAMMVIAVKHRGRRPIWSMAAFCLRRLCNSHWPGLDLRPDRH